MVLVWFACDWRLYVHVVLLLFCFLVVYLAWVGLDTHWAHRGLAGSVKGASSVVELEGGIPLRIFSCRVFLQAQARHLLLRPLWYGGYPLLLVPQSLLNGAHLAFPFGLAEELIGVAWEAGLVIRMIWRVLSLPVPTISWELLIWHVLIIYLLIWRVCLHWYSLLSVNLMIIILYVIPGACVLFQDCVGNLINLL